MAIVLDLTVVLIFAVTLFVIIKNGFVKTVMNAAAFICALIFSKLFTPALSQIIYNGLFGRYHTKLSEVIGTKITEGEIPIYFESIIKSNIIGKLNIDVASGVENVTNEASVWISKAVIGLFSWALAYLLIFVVTLIVFKLLTFVLVNVFKLPILNTVNKTLGSVLGVVVALLYVLLFVSLMQLVLPFLMSAYPETFGADIIQKSYVFSFFYNMEWLKILVN